MPYQATVFNIMIASPSDVVHEPGIIDSVVRQWNVINSEHLGKVLMPVGWKTHSSPQMGDRPQGVINQQILANADLLIAVFWTRIGTPTGRAAGGTIEEIEEHLALGKPAMIYFSSVPVQLETVDREQFDGLQAFKNSLLQRGLVETYDSLADFKEKLTTQLSLTIIRRFST